jgi:hypothetical protein
MSDRMRRPITRFQYVRPVRRGVYAARPGCDVRLHGYVERTTIRACTHARTDAYTGAVLDAVPFDVRLTMPLGGECATSIAMLLNGTSIYETVNFTALSSDVCTAEFALTPLNHINPRIAGDWTVVIGLHNLGSAQLVEISRLDAVDTTFFTPVASYDLVADPTLIHIILSLGSGVTQCCPLPVVFNDVTYGEFTPLTSSEVCGTAYERTYTSVPVAPAGNPIFQNDSISIYNVTLSTLDDSCGGALLGDSLFGSISFLATLPRLAPTPTPAASSTTVLLVVGIPLAVAWIAAAAIFVGPALVAIKKHKH